jgi:hypothetical protein
MRFPTPLKDSKSFKRVSTHFKPKSGRVKWTFIRMLPRPLPLREIRRMSMSSETLPGKGEGSLQAGADDR